MLLSLSQTDIYDVAAVMPPSKYCVNSTKEERNVKRLFYGVPEEMFLEAVQYSTGRCGWASVGLIKGYLAKKGICCVEEGGCSTLEGVEGEREVAGEGIRGKIYKIK